MKKLYRCEITKLLYVLAEDEREASRTAARHDHDENCEWGDADAQEVKADSFIEPEWDTSIPYDDNKKSASSYVGSPDYDLTVFDILAQIKEAKAQADLEARQGKLELEKMRATVFPTGTPNEDQELHFWRSRRKYGSSH